MMAERKKWMCLLSQGERVHRLCLLVAVAGTLAWLIGSLPWTGWEWPDLPESRPPSGVRLAALAWRYDHGQCEAQFY